MDGAPVHFPGLGLERNTCGAVDFGDVPHVAEAFFAGALRLQVVLDAMGEMLGFGLEVRGVAGGVGLVDIRAVDEAAEMKAFIDECLVDAEPALGAVDVKVAGHVGAIRGVAGGEDAGGEFHGP